MDEQEDPSQTQTQKGGIEMMEARMSNLGLHGKIWKSKKEIKLCQYSEWIDTMISVITELLNLIIYFRYSSRNSDVDSNKVLK